MSEEHEKWLEQRLLPPESYTEMMSYIGARIAGKKPEAAQEASKAFVATGLVAPTRSELFATIERTLLDELP